MAYKLYDINCIEIDLGDLQDKGPWHKFGEKSEKIFISKYGQELSLDINPQKLADPTVADLINTSNGKFAELKTKNTPFFKARGLYNHDPQYTVTFDLKDHDNYMKNYPNLEVYFWVSWIAVKFVDTETITVKPMEGIWKIDFQDLKELNKKAPVHEYRQRIGDKLGNSKFSYVLDLRSKGFEKIR